MKCQDAWKVLVDVSAGKEVKVPSNDAQELTSLGLVAPIKPNGNGSGARANAEMDSVKNRLAEIASEKEQLNTEMQQLAVQDPLRPPSSLGREFPHYAEKSQRLEQLDAEERTLRTRFVVLLQTSLEKVPRGTLDGRPVHVTYKGREVMTVLGQRMSRVGDIELGAFLREMEGISGYFEMRSAKAKRLLEILSPRYKQTDEIHIRLVSVGLSGKDGSAEATAEMFSETYNALASVTFMDSPTALMLSEVLTLRARDQMELGALIQKARNLIVNSWSDGPVDEDQIRAAAILLASGKDTDALVATTQMVRANYCQSSWSASAVLASAADSLPQVTTLAAQGGYNPVAPRDMTIDRHLEIYRNIHQDYGDVVGDTMSAALMASSGLPIPDVVDRFGRASQILDKFNGGSMRVPSAMIAILPNEVDEAMDNVRLASAAIMRNKLSLGGAENLSLGIKMLVHSAAMAAGGGGVSGTAASSVSAPLVLALTGITIATAFAIGASLLAFHEFSLHKIAVQDYVWHPVHTHYVYG